MDIADKEKTEVSKTQLAQFWKQRIQAANRTYSAWANRFMVSNLYQYYEGFQWLGDVDSNNRPYVVNLIYSNIEDKLPSLLFQNPEYNIRPRPIGEMYNMDEGISKAQARQDVLNFIAANKDFGLTEKHELAALDSFFGFGVIDIGYSEDESDNPYINGSKYNDPLDNLYCKHIPFDHFRVAANANWDLSMGRWCGYFEFVPNYSLEKYADKLNLDKASYLDEDSEAAQFMMSGKITIGEDNEELTPSNHTKIWRIWDFATNKFIKLADENANNIQDSLLEYEDFKHCGISTLRYTKRRRGWYPLPPVFNWISPQDEINDIRQTHKIHRKRYARKYEILENAVEPEEEQKFLYGPDGTTFKVKRHDAIKAVEDAPLDTANQQSMIVSYDDFLRVGGGRTEQGRISDRTTATQANINNQLSQIRESKSQLTVGNFMCSIGHSILSKLQEVKADFWAAVGANNEGILQEMQQTITTWKRIPPNMFADNDYSLDVRITSISPIYLQQDKQAFMEFLAIITQYEILAFSPELLREAAYRVGYKNQAVLSQFMQLSQLAAIGREAQAKAQVQQVVTPQGPQQTAPGQLAQQQTSISTPPDMEQISNLIFNKQGIQQPQ